MNRDDSYIGRCPACMRGGLGRLFNGVCYECLLLQIDSKPAPIVTPCPRRPAPSEAVR